MKLATLRMNGCEIAAIVLNQSVLPLCHINESYNTDWMTDLQLLLDRDQFFPLLQWFQSHQGDLENRIHSKKIPLDEASFGPLLRYPRKIWGIGLNYPVHAADLKEQAPQESPASFMRPDTTIIGPGDNICIPKLSQRTTGEGELGIIMARKGQDLDSKNWIEYIAGFTTILDMTAEDILRLNPRYLTRAKSFATFFSFGPLLLTPDELPDLPAIQVATVLNGEIYAQDQVANMTFSPEELVCFHSQIFPWLPGDIISTGTPRAVAIHHGDLLECRIDGFPPLRNPVIDLKMIR
ncbi:MAG: fumarylacetoacetate hydrolase family protein [Syntrophales bacterium LBB04]|nr:fumarylacetoacetate hydrolase family protein [Syntrophales bacterium LBB04]